MTDLMVVERRSPGRRRGERDAMTPATVFVVDDDPAVRKSLTRMAASVGYAVEAFASAEEFLAREPFVRPCCVVLDVRMPGCNGLDLQETLGRSGRRLPIVFITGHGDVSMSVEAMKRGAVDFLTKPFDVDTLLHAIERAVARDVKDLDEEGRTADVRERAQAPDPARDRGLRPRRDRHAEQADRGRARHRREDRQGAPRPGHGEDAGRIGGAAGAASPTGPAWIVLNRQ